MVAEKWGFERRPSNRQEERGLCHSSKPPGAPSSESSESGSSSVVGNKMALETETSKSRPPPVVMASETKEETPANAGNKDDNDIRILNDTASSTTKIKPVENDSKSSLQVVGASEACLPKPPAYLQNQTQLSQTKSTKPASISRYPVAEKFGGTPVLRGANAKNVAGTPGLAQENQAIKRQKLERGRIRPAIAIYGRLAPSHTVLRLNQINMKEMSYVREPATPFVSMAEMMKKFQSSTRDISMPLNTSASHLKKFNLYTNKAQDTEFETANRVRSTKILEAQTMPALSRSAPHPPEFKHASTVAEISSGDNGKGQSECRNIIDNFNGNFTPGLDRIKIHPHLTELKIPRHETSLRACPPKVKSSQELEQQIFECEGELGIFWNTKCNVTIPQEFHFATDERIPPPTAVADLFDKLSLHSEPRHDEPVTRITSPNTFNLYTEARGAEKERRFVLEVVQKQIEEEKARIPKANPYPYTTDYPVIPPKAAPKGFFPPKPFQLESLVRHEVEMQKEMEERQRLEKEEAEIRLFKAQPIMKEDPIPVPEKARKRLT
ncbi:hypothetical protein RJ641_015517 [Dillenia turbinata]|uniref:TPX2 C-terminal domain-containing protein n=1 Tax=Dillenia turbinata TaxID=194707 RepID=A0AAN8UMF6_9MAGN